MSAVAPRLPRRNDARAMIRHWRAVRPLVLRLTTRSRHCSKADGGLHGPYDFDLVARTVRCAACRQALDPFAMMLAQEWQADSLDRSAVDGRFRVISVFNRHRFIASSSRRSARGR